MLVRVTLFGTDLGTWLQTVWRIVISLPTSTNNVGPFAEMSLLIRVEGVDHSQTIFDTNDLSTQRGASLAYLAAPSFLIEAAKDIFDSKVEKVWVGASAGVFWLHVEKDPSEVERKLSEILRDPSKIKVGAAKHNGGSFWTQLDLDPVLPHLNFVVVAEKIDDDDKKTLTQARFKLLARARQAQLQSPTVSWPKPKDNVWIPCRLNPNLPANGEGGLSLSVMSRRTFGRYQKHKFYQKCAFGIDFNLTKAGCFAKELGHLVCKPPDWVKLAVQNKIAHFYLDGNSFTRKREGMIGKAGDALKAEKEFSKSVQAARGKMLRELLSALEKIDEMSFVVGDKNNVNEVKNKIFRFETLLWGGDEAAFVMPAWAALFALKTLSENFTKDEWKMDGEMLTQKVGIYICDRKTPIVIAKKIAESLADSAKMGIPDNAKGDANVAQIMVTESAEPPMDITNLGPDALKDYREKYFGWGDPKAFTIHLDKDISGLIDGLAKVQSEEGGLPRSQLYELLRNKTPGIGSDEWQAARDSVFERSGAKCKDIFDTPPFGNDSLNNKHHLLPFMRVAELLDYYCPETFSKESED